jgi:hypothetical protein
MVVQGYEQELRRESSYCEYSEAARWQGKEYYE